jgi:hypothetical protein
MFSFRIIFAILVSIMSYTTQQNNIVNGVNLGMVPRGYQLETENTETIQKAMNEKGFPYEWPDVHELKEAKPGLAFKSEGESKADTTGIIK